MRRFLKVLWLVSIIAGVVSIAAVHRGDAAPPDPPAQMELADAIRLDRDIMHLAQADTEINKIVEQVKPYRTDALSILERFKVSMHDFKTGAVTIDFTTGAIHRTQKAEAGAALPTKAPGDNHK